ncbi:hypothetical protein ACOY5N_22640, partial [Enterobacter kobei]|uniref:hypothetical protein n=5 Tax=Enterobacter kobei TaxID=208224 RepID=UPI003BD2A158
MSLVRFRVRAPLFKEPSLWLGFCFSAFINPFFYILASLSGEIVQSALPDGGFALSVLRENFKERNKTQSKKPRTLRYGVLLFDAWQFPTLTWG